MTQKLDSINKYHKSPLNYIGGKYKILPQILPLFPKKIDTFIDLFCGGCNVAINIESKKIICNDNLSFLIELYKYLQQNTLASTLKNIESIINFYKLDMQNKNGYLALRSDYNAQKEPLKLLALIAFSFNHQIRFNNSHNFNNPFGKNRSNFNANMMANLIHFIQILQRKNMIFYSLDFRVFLDSMHLDKHCFVYADPPYLITQGVYNDGKRGFSGWSESLEISLLENLKELDSKGVKFALSNVLTHKGIENHILKQWIESRGYFVSDISHHYTNANYQSKYKDKSLTKEVLITNYAPKMCH